MNNEPSIWLSPAAQQFLESASSTTAFLENLSGKNPSVEMLAQTEEAFEGRPVLKQESLLYIDEPDAPLMFARCRLFIDALTDHELDKLRGGRIPVGRVFDPENEGLVHQDNSCIRTVNSNDLARLLKTAFGPGQEHSYTRSYDLLVKDRLVAHIDESTNEESLLRSFTGENAFANLVRWISESRSTARSVLSDGCHVCSYADLPKVLDGIATYLSELGVGPDDGVVLECVNTLPAALTLLTLLRDNYNVHLTPALTTSSGKGRSPAGAPAFLRHRLKIVSGLNNDQIRLDKPETFLVCSPNPACRETSARSFDRTGCLLVKTSGSLGSPKLAIHRSEKLINNVMRAAERLRLHSQDRVTIPVPIFHMYGLGAGYLPALFAGASIDFQENSNLLRYLEREEEFSPNIAVVTPSFCETLLARRSNREYRFIVSAGERMSEDTFFKVESRFGSVINLYGSTEMGVIAATPLELAAQLRATTVGPVLPGIRVDLVETSNHAENGDPCYELFLDNKSGFELYVDSEGNAVDTPSLTARGGGKTGDLVKMNDDGLMSVLGRNSLSMNRNGYLVVFAEIERQMKDLGGIERVALAAKQVNNSRSELIAFCELPEGSAANTGDEIRAKCLDRLPRFAVPDNIHVVAKMPLLPNGKIDRQALTALTADDRIGNPH